MNKNMRKIGLSLSGGGQRAAAFHLGVLKKLDTLNILQKIKLISTISGGSIIGSYYCLSKDFIEFEKEFKKILKMNIELKTLCNPSFIFKFILIISCLFALYIFISIKCIPIEIISSLLILFFYLFKIFPTGKALQRTYNKYIFKNKYLSDLPSEPELLINSTNLQTGTLFTFSKSLAKDSTYEFRYGYIPKFNLDKIPISFAVAASSAFPPIISPLELEKVYILDYNTVIQKGIFPKLSDGGLYDNQGIYRLRKSNIEIQICSDGSSPYDREEYSTVNPFKLLLRIINVLTRRIRAFQYVNSLFENNKIYETAYFSIDWEYEKCLTNFVELVFQNKVKKNVLEFHNINEELMTINDEKDKQNKTEQILNLLKNNINFSKIIENSLNSSDIKELSKISTRLNGLKDKQIENLIKHGETLTEIQIKLYCPSLFVELS